ncbi:MAG: hypothetical protein AB7S78_03790 [Candidatus Omnitrophota bacterium]
MRSSRGAAAVLGIVLLWPGIPGESNETAVWEKISNGLNETYVQSVAMISTGQQSILAGTSKGLYMSPDGHNFRSLFSFPGDQTNVNAIHFDKVTGTILAATDSGLYKSSDQGRKFDRVFYSSDSRENRCLSVFYGKEGVYLGTQKGLFYQGAGQTGWGKIFNPLSLVPVYQILKDDAYIYFVSGHTIFRLKESASVPDEIFTDQPGDVQELDDTTEIIQEDKTVNFVSLSGEGGIIVSADSGLSYSPDFGSTWQRFDQGIVPYKEINGMLPVSVHCGGSTALCLRFLAATDNGVFLYAEGRWIPLYKGLDAGRVNDLDISEERMVIAATENGIYKLPLNETLAMLNDTVNHAMAKIDYDEFKSRIKDEPSIHEVQRLAIEYAEVHPDKIKAWRRSAQKKAWAPSLNIGIDGGRSLTRADSIYGSSSSGGAHYIAPDDKSSRDDLGWDVSLSWDLADVIWSTDQTTIDSRSKLMVELREDILNQVTRLYYERLRLQAELQGIGEDLGAVFDRKMRIDELTALLDGLTGGEFSLRLNEREYQNYTSK